MSPDPTADTTERPNPRKVREGVVTSASMEKTAIVTVTSQYRHRLYGKTVKRSTKLYTHDETNDLKVGDRVRVAETRPLSKLKRWRLLEVLEQAR
ncbi:30S ribosomal protein S17 [Iamia sp.]|uniref:30S ribosomal protein S17 n=1 Tax=Iamia sp. TaxID=2722710 RepID=UPI002C5999B9|nr:30S ribosomal protein S17 [Iamia sp.]HXH56470.1 30S ribosomal protein S17 [Iamia sp.]